MAESTWRSEYPFQSRWLKPAAVDRLLLESRLTSPHPITGMYYGADGPHSDLVFGQVLAQAKPQLQVYRVALSDSASDTEAIHRFARQVGYYNPWVAAWEPKLDDVMRGFQTTLRWQSQRKPREPRPVVWLDGVHSSASGDGNDLLPAALQIASDLHRMHQAELISVIYTVPGMTPNKLKKVPSLTEIESLSMLEVTAEDVDVHGEEETKFLAKLGPHLGDLALARRWRSQAAASSTDHVLEKIQYQRALPLHWAYHTAVPHATAVAHHIFTVLSDTGPDKNMQVPDVLLADLKVKGIDITLYELTTIINPLVKAGIVHWRGERKTFRLEFCHPISGAAFRGFQKEYKWSASAIQQERNEGGEQRLHRQDMTEPKPVHENA